MTDQRLAWLNAILANRHSRHTPNEPRWVFCEHCDEVREVSVVDSNRCVVCAPAPADAQRRAWEVRSRVREAVRAATATSWWKRGEA